MESRICCCFVSLLLLLFIAADSAAGAAELLREANNPACWTLQKSSGGDGSLAQGDGGLRINVAHASSQNWHVQVFQDRLTVRDDTDYLLRFSAKASPARKITITCQASESPWRYVTNPTFQTVDLTTQWKDYSVPLHFKDARNDAIRVPMFLVGDVAGTVWIKNSSVTTGTAGSPTPVNEAVYGPPPSADTNELLREPMKPGSWKFDNRGNAGNTFRSDGDALRLDVSNANPDRHSVMIYQLPEGLTEGRTYQLSITAKASAPRAVTFGTQRDVAPYETVLPDTNLNLTTDWKKYQIRFKLKKVYPGQTRLPCLSVGDVAGTVFIRSISLMPYDEAGK